MKGEAGKEAKDPEWSGSSPGAQQREVAFGWRARYGWFVTVSSAFKQLWGRIQSERRKGSKRGP